ncbi:MAG: 30S ribosomal protein S6 [Bacteroidia bacterium]
MSNRYESIFITTPLLTEDQTKEVVDKFKDLLNSHESKIVNEENWGLRKLAYPIKKKSTGFYHLLEFEANPELIAKLEVEYKRDERILRFLTVKLDKYAQVYADRRRKGEVGKKPKAFSEKEKEEENV